MLLSIIIINYNTFQLTCNCIRSIKNTTHVEHEIILIDNNSKECRADEFLGIFPDLKLIALNENIGFGRANNRGVEESKGKYVLLLNSDTIVHENTIDETVKCLEQNPKFDILGCKVFTNNGVVQRTVYEYKGELSILGSIIFFIKRNSIIKEFTSVVYAQIEKYRNRKVERSTKISDSSINGNPMSLIPNYRNGKRIGALNGVFLLLKRSVFIESKGFDPDFFMYDEEINWFLKRLRNYNIVYYPNASILHYYGKSNVYNKMSLQHFVSQYLFWYKISKLHFILFLLYNVIDIPCKTIVSLVKGDKSLLSEVTSMFKAFPYALFDIPRYSNKYGSRREMLKLKSLKRKGL